MSRPRLWAPGPSQTYWADARRLASALPSAAPALLFGLRLWAAVCLALYTAFWLELDNPYWAGTTAALVSQPHLGASLRNGWYRMIGTVVGSTAIVLLTACFPQDRIGFLVSVALWIAACSFLATLLRNFSTFAPALAGITAAIIAGDELGATGGANGQAFMLAVSRASEIAIGVVSAGIVLAGTDFGNAQRRLAVQLAAISAEITGRLAGTFLLTGQHQSETLQVRRDLLRRVIALGLVIDEALAESSDLRPHSPVLQAAVGGLFSALSGWRMVALHLAQLPSEQGRREAELIRRDLPQVLLSAPVQGEATSWTVDPSGMRKACAAAVRALTVMPVRTPSLRLLADRTAAALLGIRRALIGLALLVNDPARPVPRRDRVRFQVPDWLPALVNAARAFVTIGAVELFWIVTAWPNGASAITFSAVGVILFALRADQAYATAMSFMVGASLAAAFAAIIKFAVLPGVETFAGFSLAIGLVLVPAGALSSWQPAMSTAMAGLFCIFLAPTNPVSYDTQQFYNATLAIIAGLGAAALAFRLLPPLPPALRTRRLLSLTLRDLRRLTTAPVPRTVNDWNERIYSRLSALPEQAEPLQRSQLLAALAVGAEIIRLCHIARRFALRAELAAVLNAVARGDSVVATERLGQLDRMLGALSSTAPGARVRLRARGSILAMSEALAEHAAYFDSGAAR
jgi:uncharacterized membrane protein YccC